MKALRWIWPFALLFAAVPAHALKFSNQFIEFELPYNWHCSQGEAEWTCQNTDSSKRKEAVLILAAKMKGEQDSMEQYLAYLSKPRERAGSPGSSSQPRYARVTQFGTQNWVDALHVDSEIPGFYTRYLATIHEDIGVLVSYSVQKAKYESYGTQFDALVRSIKVFRPAPSATSLAAKPKDSKPQALTPFLGQAPATEPAATPASGAGGTGEKHAAPDLDFKLIGVVVAFIAAFIFFRKRNSGG